VDLNAKKYMFSPQASLGDRKSTKSVFLVLKTLVRRKKGEI
jgi:hypothetical protein